MSEIRVASRGYVIKAMGGVQDQFETDLLELVARYNDSILVKRLYPGPNINYVSSEDIEFPWSERNLDPYLTEENRW